MQRVYPTSLRDVYEFWRVRLDMSSTLPRVSGSCGEYIKGEVVCFKPLSHCHEFGLRVVASAGELYLAIISILGIIYKKKLFCDVFSGQCYFFTFSVIHISVLLL